MRVDTLMPIDHQTATIRISSEEESDGWEQWGDDGKKRFYKEVSLPTKDLSDAFESHGLASEQYSTMHGNEVIVRGWNVNITELQTGDRVSHPLRRTPLEVIEIHEPGDAPTTPLPVDNDLQYIGDDTHYIVLDGGRGGIYIWDYDPDREPATYQYSRDTADADILQRDTSGSEDGTVIFAGNVETGPRRERELIDSDARQQLETRERPQ
jgi:hypothetical protein